ncbi:hypothetical protein ACHAXA_003393, partial [Cyclostephanos tholiformis]
KQQSRKKKRKDGRRRSGSMSGPNVIPESKCGDACGYTAAILAAICFGSFGVPVKSEIVSRLDVDPLVMQSYKSIMGFVTCWLILPMGQPLRFTSWGILSGIFWVPGGIAGIYGIRTAGLAVAVGTWSSLIVLTSFGWGVFVFEEHVRSMYGASCACMTLISGLVGMSIYSRPTRQRTNGGARDAGEVGGAVVSTKLGSDSLVADEDGVRKRMHVSSAKDGQTKETTTCAVETSIAEKTKGGGVGGIGTSKRLIAKKMAPPSMTKSIMDEVRPNGEKVTSSSHQQFPSLPLPSLEMEFLLHDDVGGGEQDDPSSRHDNDKSSWTVTIFERQITLSRRQAGLLACLFNGLWGGTSMIPLHFAAHDGYGGPSYVISFCCGSMLVTVSLWILRFLFELHRHEGSPGVAYHALPSFHLRQMWIQGGLSGTLWSMGNFFAIISVTHLGQGVGYSFVQASMLVSGLWGIFRFKEIEGRERILKWLTSAFIALTGIMWLSYEHAS